MKKFRFSLDTVLSYKQQIQDTLQGEHAELLAAVRRQEEYLQLLWDKYREYGREYRERCETGLPITDVLIYQGGLRAMERDIQLETERLEQIRRQEEKKREEVIEAKKETSSIEKLKEKKLKAYNKAVEKSDEAFIEEFVSTGRVRAASN